MTNYKFNGYILDTALYELRKNGCRVAIEPQVFSLLRHLIENRTHVVSKEDLISAIWNDRAISDTTLSSRIFALRRAVGDTGKAQEILQTIPRRGFRFIADVETLEGIEDHPTAQPDAPDPIDYKTLTEIPRLAVLPFKNVNADLDGYFCDGLTEDIIANLTYFREIAVIAGGSSLQFKDRDLSLSKIANTLKANYLVVGSARRDKDRVRISVQLVDMASGVSIWADRYDRGMTDIFAVQDELTHKIVATLGINVQNAALSRALRKSPAKLDAYDCLLHARRYTATLIEEMHSEARDLLEKAIALDENYADAYALLANVYLAEHRFEVNKRPDPVGRARSMALKAIQLDPQNAYAHCWLAITHFFQKEMEKFEVEIQRALDLNPNDPEILAEAGHYLSYMGDFERGIKLSQKARLLNPLHPGWYNFSFARHHYHLCQYEEMLVDIQWISMPNFYWTHLLRAAALGQLGRTEEAKLSLSRMITLKPGICVADEMRKWNLSAHDFNHVMAGLKKSGFEA